MAGIDFRNGVEQKFIGIAKNSEGFHELNKLLSEYLFSGERFSDKTPALQQAWIVYPLLSAPQQLLENEFVGIKPTELFQLNFSQWKSKLHKLVALAPVTFRNKTDFNSHRLLRAISYNTLLSKLPVAGQAPADEIMYSPEEMKYIYKEYPQLIYNTEKLLESCHIDFEFGKNKNKKYFWAVPNAIITN